MTSRETRSKVMQNQQFYTTIHRILITAEYLNMLFYANFRYLLSKALVQLPPITPTCDIIIWGEQLGVTLCDRKGGRG